jgi:hypothetical protein
MIKDLENLREIANNYKTIPIVYGDGFKKNYITFFDYSACVCPN